MPSSFKVQSSKFRVQSSPPVLLIEGAGGLLSPLGEPGSGSRITHHASRRIYTALDLVVALSQAYHASRITHHVSRFTFNVLLVAPNRLGAINHTLLTLDKLKEAGISPSMLVLNDLVPQSKAGLETRYNGPLLAELAIPVALIRLSCVGKCTTAREITERAKKLRNPLQKICGPTCL
jgi:dethiobiotin synthetase